MRQRVTSQCRLSSTWALAVVSLLIVTHLYPRPTSAQGDDMARAREAFSRGQELFDAGNYTDAREAFQESLDAFPHYRTIFNIALCEEKLGRISEAMAFYQRYVVWPGDVPNRDEVRAKLKQLRELLPPDIPDEQEQPPEPPPEEDETEPPPVQPPKDDGPNLVVPGWITTGVGAAGVITGGVLLGLAQARAKEVEDQEGTYKGDYHDSMQEQGRNFERSGWIVGGIGVAAIAAGVVMLLVSRGDEEEATPNSEQTAMLIPLEGGLSFGTRWSF